MCHELNDYSKMVFQFLVCLEILEELFSVLQNSLLRIFSLFFRYEVRVPDHEYDFDLVLRRISSLFLQGHKVVLEY